HFLISFIDVDDIVVLVKPLQGDIENRVPRCVSVRHITLRYLRQRHFHHASCLIIRKCKKAPVTNVATKSLSCCGEVDREVFWKGSFSCPTLLLSFEPYHHPREADQTIVLVFPHGGHLLVAGNSAQASLQDHQAAPTYLATRPLPASKRAESRLVLRRE